jgi:hypothetical protein
MGGEEESENGVSVSSLKVNDAGLLVQFSAFAVRRGTDALLGSSGA